MLHVILQILAVIGIVLLCILGLLLLLILLVLFVPIRYRIKGEKSAEVMRAEAKATYLLHFLSVKFTYESESRLIARMCGIKIYDSAKKKTSEENLSGQPPESVPVEGVTAEDIQVKDIPAGEVPAKQAESFEETKDRPTENIEENKNVAEPGKKEGFFSKIKNKILAIIEKIKYTITSIYDKIKNIAETVSYYKQVLDDKENRAMYKRVWERIVKVLKSIRPRKLQADLLVGTGSPDTTGYICALYGMLIPVFGEHVNFVSDFEEKVFEGHVYAKGKITIFTILVQALKLFFDKQIRIFISQLKREDK